MHPVKNAQVGENRLQIWDEKEQQPDMYGGEMDSQSLFTFILEMAGTIAFAASGAMVGAQRGMDIFGICVLGVVTAVGGGATRDIILGIVPPGMFQNPIYTIGNCDILYCVRHNVLETGTAGRREPAGL